MYKLGQYAARLALGLEKTALNPALKQFLQRATVGMGTGAGIGWVIAPRPEDRPRMALYSGLADLPVLGISHAPDVMRHLRETRPGFAQAITKLTKMPSALRRIVLRK